MAVPRSTQLTMHYLHLRHIENGKTLFPMWSRLDGVMQGNARLSITIPVALLFAAAITAALSDDLVWRGVFVILALLSLAYLCARLPLLGCMVIVFVILVFNEYPVEQFRTQADDLAFYAYNAWRLFFPGREFVWLKITTIDVLILAVAIGLFFAALRQRVALVLTPQSVLVVAFASVVMAMFLWGMATGGELEPAAWQVRPYLEMAAIALLLPQAVRNAADLRLIVWTLVAAVTVKAAQVIWIFFFLAEGHFSHNWRELVDHEDSIFIVACFGFLLALFICDNHPTKRLVLSVLSATIVAALLFNLRRVGYVALGFTLLLTPIVAYGHRRSALKIVAALSAIVLCLAVLGHDQGTLSLVVQKLRSSFEGAAVGTEDYYSNFYRYGENLNLWQAIISNPLGTGFGKPFPIEVPLDDISTPLWQYFPHNMILGIWMSLGTIGFVVFLALVAGVMVAANFSVKEASDPFIEAVSVFCVVGLAVALLAGSVDQFMSSQRSAMFVGVIIGLGSAISFMQGCRVADLGKFGMVNRTFASVCSRRSFLLLGLASMRVAASPLKAHSKASRYPTLGFNLVEWDDDANRDADRWVQSVKDIFAMGIPRVSVVPYWFVDPKRAEVYELSPKNNMPRGPTTDVILRSISAAHELGMSVVLRPLIEIDSKGSQKQWRGNLLIREEKLKSFFNSYGAYIQQMAELALAGGAEVFYIGTELASLTKDAAALPFWIALIGRLRRLFPGGDRRLSYAANYDEYSHVPFWGQLDEIGIDAYFPLATREEIRRLGGPDAKEMAHRWREIFTDLRTFSENQDRRVTFSEFGLVPYKFTSTHPWDGRGLGKFDLTEQLNGFESLLTAMQSEGQWLNGIDFWHWRLADGYGSKYNITTHSAVGRLIASYAGQQY